MCIFFNTLAMINQFFCLQQKQMTDKTWDELGIDSRILGCIKKKLKFKEPTQVQQKAIPVILKGKDCITKAQTGTGKTAAYAIPAIQFVLGEKKVCKIFHVTF